MKNLNLWNIPFWIACISMVLGIITSSFLSIDLYWCLGTLVVLLSILHSVRHKNTPLFIGVTCILFFVLGICRYQLVLPKYLSQHITQQTGFKSPKEVVFVITKQLNDSKNYKNYTASLKSIRGEIIRGKFLLKVKKQAQLTLNIGEAYTGYIKLQSLPLNNFPYGFDYNNYLKNHGITHQVKTDFTSLISTPAKRDKLNYTPEKLQSKLNTSLNNLDLDPSVKEFTAALVLGNKKALDYKTKEAFSKAGVTHILAISGLHVGVVYLLFGGLLGLVFYGYQSRILKSIGVLLLLWLFVVFTGASDSALRAATMFSCFEIGRLWVRRQHSLNVLFLSVFILVLIHPQIIFSIGFQLSVIAVGSIIIGLPIWYTLWKPKNRIGLFLWSITGVSLCAQIGLLPLSIYYFHQIPGLFLIANIPVMSIIPIVMIFALVVVTGGYFSILPKAIIVGYNYAISKLIKFIIWVGSQEMFVIKNLYLSIFTVLISYAFFGYLLWLIYNKRKAIQYIFIMIFGIMCSSFIEINRSFYKHELWTLKTSNNAVIIEISSNNIDVYSSKPLSDFIKKYKIEPLRGELHCTNLIYHSLQQAYVYESKKIQLIDQDFIPNIDCKGAIFMVSNSPKVNAERLLKKYLPKKVIFTANNYKTIVNQWKITCNKLDIPYNDISEIGSIKIVP